MRIARWGIVLLLVTAARVAFAQARTAVIDGVVTDSSLLRLSGATVTLVGTRTEVTTDALGRFRVLQLPAGRYVLMIRRIGYVSLPSVVEVAAGDTVRGSFMLERIVPSLDTVVVAARTPDTYISEFEQRRRQGVGQFMTRDEIHKLNFVELSTYLLTFKSTQVIGGKLLNRRDMPSKSCPFQFFIDGVLVNTPEDVNAELPRPAELQGIEVYSGAATIPLQYKPMGGERSGGGFCGVVLLWTRRGA
ncbi:MAG: carboxypeptidase regulatory-like domain-containing protein [Gemmatimonadaceae bacterium]